MNTKKLKPFNLQTALNGEPVILRDGTKAYVRHHETELKTHALGRLLGYAEGDAVDAFMTWRKDGVHAISRYDILGMWPRTRIVNGFELVAPERTPPVNGETYYIPNIKCSSMCDRGTWHSDSFDLRVLKRGLVFLNSWDAIATTKAMLGIDPYKEYED